MLVSRQQSGVWVGGVCDMRECDPREEVRKDVKHDARRVRTKTRMGAQEVSVCRLVGAPKMNRYTKQRILGENRLFAMRI